MPSSIKSHCTIAAAAAFLLICYVMEFVVIVKEVKNWIHKLQEKQLFLDMKKTYNWFGLFMWFNCSIFHSHFHLSDWEDKGERTKLPTWNCELLQYFLNQYWNTEECICVHVNFCFTFNNSILKLKSVALRVVRPPSFNSFLCFYYCLSWTFE